MSWEKVLKFIPEHRDDFQKWLKKSYNELVKYFKQDTLSRIPKSITKEWGKEEWAALQENAENETKSFIQTVAFDNKIYPKEFLQEEFKSFIRKGEIKKGRTMKTKHKNIVFNGMSDGKWRTIKEMERDFNLKEVWPRFNGGALAYYLKNSTGAGAKTGVGEEIYDRRKVKKGGYGSSGRVSKHVWEFRLKTELLHKASLINVGSVTLDNRELPEEDDDEKCRDRILRIIHAIRSKPNHQNVDAKFYGNISRAWAVRPKARHMEIIEKIPEDVLCFALQKFDKIDYTDTGTYGGTQYKGYEIRVYKNAYLFYDWDPKGILRVNPAPITDTSLGPNSDRGVTGAFFHYYIESLIEIGREVLVAGDEDLSIKFHSRVSYETSHLDHQGWRDRGVLEHMDDNDELIEYVAEFDEGAKELLNNIKEEMKYHKEVYS